MSSIVAVAGGSSGLGRSIIDALKESSKYTPLVLSRKSDPEVEKKIGARIVAVDYTNVDAIAKALEDNNIDTVINCVGVVGDPSPLYALISAADKAKTTKRFIPNLWSAILYEPEHKSISPIVATRLQQLDLLASTSLEWTSIFNGFFMEYPAPNIPTYNTTMPIFLDMVHNAAGIPGSGDYPVHFTYTRDIGRYTAALLSLSNWDKRYLIAGDTKTLKEAVALGEKVKGTKFDVSFDSIEKLERGEYTELPGYAAAFAYLGAADVGKEMLGHMMVFFSLMFARGYASFKGAKWLNEMFPEIKPLGLEEALVMSFGEGKKE